MNSFYDNSTLLLSSALVPYVANADSIMDPQAFPLSRVMKAVVILPLTIVLPMMIGHYLNSSITRWNISQKRYNDDEDEDSEDEDSEEIPVFDEKDEVINPFGVATPPFAIDPTDSGIPQPKKTLPTDFVFTTISKDTSTSTRQDSFKSAAFSNFVIDPFLNPINDDNMVSGLAMFDHDELGFLMKGRSVKVEQRGSHYLFTMEKPAEPVFTACLSGNLYASIYTTPSGKLVNLNGLVKPLSLFLEVNEMSVYTPPVSTKESSISHELRPIIPHHELRPIIPQPTDSVLCKTTSGKEFIIPRSSVALVTQALQTLSEA
jgi:hypothetical protein